MLERALGHAPDQAALSAHSIETLPHSSTIPNAELLLGQPTRCLARPHTPDS